MLYIHKEHNDSLDSNTIVKYKKISLQPLKKVINLSKSS